MQEKAAYNRLKVAQPLSGHVHSGSFMDWTRMNKIKLFEAMEVFFERSQRSGMDEHHNARDVVRRCGLCQESDMVLRRKPDGNFMVGCFGFPQCRNAVWLPGSISEASVTTNVCNICSSGPVFMIQFKFRRLEIPPDYNVDHLGCIGGCDDTLKQLTEICGTGSRNLTSAPARGRGPTTSFSSVQRSTSRRGSCIHCRQTGHSSNDCPSRAPSSHNIYAQGPNPPNGECSIPCNTCGTPCTLRTAGTANNRGRKFYSCASRECNFFVWEDNLNGESAQHGNTSRSASSSRGRGSNRDRDRGRGSDRGRGRGGRNVSLTSDTRFVSATGEPISGRNCFVCGDPSHFANVCPNRGI